MAESESSIKVCVKTQKQKYEINSSPLSTIKEVSCSFDATDQLYWIVKGTYLIQKGSIVYRLLLLIQIWKIYD